MSAVASSSLAAPRPGGRVLVRLRRNQSVLLLCGVLVALVIVGLIGIEGFTEKTNITSILLLSSFLGIAAIGQTLVALVGGIDVSIPFVMTSANIGLAKLLSLGWSPVAAVLAVLAAAALIGVLNGLLSWTLGVHPLLVTLGVGFALLGGIEVFYSNAQSGAPEWLTQLSSANGKTFGLGVPPIVVIWILLGAVVILALRQTVLGRYVYASGDNPVAAERMYARRRMIWIGLFMLSAMAAAAAGILLLGFTGAGDTTVGAPYLLTTIAAVVVGGTTLLGGVGGYSRTMVGALLLSVLNTLLVGFGVDPNLQQTVLGLIIVAMVSLYARESHPRNSI